MINKLKLTILLLVLCISVTSKAQNVYHEVGVATGVLQFQGDWGDSREASTSTENLGFSFSLMHYSNFAYSRRYNNYFNQHFKVRNQFSVYQVNLNHFGEYVENESAPFLLENMYGKTTVVELGTGLEWYWLNLRNYERYYTAIQPYAGFGLNYVYFNPTVDTRLPGQIGSITNTWPTFLPATPNGESRISNEPASTFSFNFQVGTRYRINKDLDFLLEARWHYYFSDFVDGLNPDNPNNTNNDWIFLVNVGLTYYLD